MNVLFYFFRFNDLSLGDSQLHSRFWESKGSVGMLWADYCCVIKFFLVSRKVNSPQKVV